MTDARGRLVAPLAFAALLAVIAAATVGAVPPGDSQPDGETLIDRAEKRYASAESLVGGATIRVVNDTRSVSGTVSFVLAGGNRTRLAVNRSGHRHVLATNGTVAWAYNESSGRLVVREVPGPGNGSAWNGTWTGDTSAWNGSAWNGTWTGDTSAWNGSAWNGTWAGVNATEYVAENVTAETVRTETVDGAETYVVELRHADGAAGNVTLWITREAYTVVRLRAARGDVRTTVAFDDQRFNVSVHDSEFRPPTDAAASVTRLSHDSYDEFDAAQAATAIDLRAPGGGYAFERAVVTTRAGRRLVAQEYADGNRTVGVFATAGSLPVPANGTAVTVAGEPATLVETPGGTVVFWERGDVSRAVAGDLPREDLLSVADRVRS